MTYTEMVSAKGLYYGGNKTNDLTYIPDGAGPTAIQIFGSEPEIMAYAARELDSLKNEVLDINMGCPVPKVVRNGDGSALMRDPELVCDIVKAVTSATAKPVTVKIRKGFDRPNAVEVALAAQEGGASAVCVHGRTRSQYYSGETDRNSPVTNNKTFFILRCVYRPASRRPQKYPHPGRHGWWRSGHP